MKTNLKKLRPTTCFTAFVFLALLIPASRIAEANEFNKLPVKGMVTMIDLGAIILQGIQLRAPRSTSVTVFLTGMPGM